MQILRVRFAQYTLDAERLDCIPTLERRNEILIRKESLWLSKLYRVAR